MALDIYVKATQSHLVNMACKGIWNVRTLGLWGYLVEDTYSRTFQYSKQRQEMREVINYIDTYRSFTEQYLVETLTKTGTLKFMTDGPLNVSL